MIEGLIQGIKYGSDSHRLFFHLRHEGSDVTSVDVGTAKVAIYDPAGTAILTATAMTQVGETAVFYYDLDASATSTFAIGFGYRCLLTWEVDSIAYEDNIYVDVVKWPFNEPLVTSEEIDTMRPGWKGKKPGAWSDWTEAIHNAHVALQHELRKMQDNMGLPVYAHRLLDRTQLRKVEIDYVYKEIATNIRMDEDELLSLIHI